MIQIGIIGMGRWGKNLVRVFHGLPDCEVKYLCDVSETARTQMARSYPAATVTDQIDPVLTDKTVQAVVIAVDAPRHFDVASKALLAGKHVYVEKPLTLTASDAQALIDLAAENRCKLMVGHLLEYHPAVDYMKQQVTSSQINPLYAYFQRVNLGVVRNNENAWWSLAPHDISVACHLFNAKPTSISATGHAYLQQGIEDVVFATVNFDSGQMAHIHVSWLDPHKIRKVTVVGQDKMIVFDDMEPAEKVRVYDKGFDTSDDAATMSEALAVRNGDILIPRLPGREPLQVECQHFIDAIAKDQAILSDGADGLKVVKVLEAGTQSIAQHGTPVRID